MDSAQDFAAYKPLLEGIAHGGQRLIHNYAKAGRNVNAMDVCLAMNTGMLRAVIDTVERDVLNLPDRLRRHFADLVHKLYRLLNSFEEDSSGLPSSGDMSFMAKARWILYSEAAFAEHLDEMEKWTSRLKGWIEAIALLRQAKGDEDRALYSELFEKWGGAGVRSASKAAIAWNDWKDGAHLPQADEATLTLLKATGNLKDGDRVIVKMHLTFAEGRFLEVGSPQENRAAMLEVEKIAFALGKVDAASTHILRCRGTAHESQISYARSLLFYEIPSEPTSDMKWTLAQYLEGDRELSPTLNVRIRYAVEIATAVMFTHTAELVHKSISAENVLILKNSSESESRHEFSTYLVGFDAARSRDLSAFTARRPEVDPLKRIYHHPERQIADAEGTVVRFGIRHDMYSLGVVLLELGMWKRIRHIDDKDLQKIVDVRGRTSSYDPHKLRDKLVELAGALGGLTGTKYAAVVRCCLEDTDSGQTEERKMRETFYEQVLQSLKEIVV